MAKGKKKNRRNLGDSTDEEKEHNEPPASTTEKKMSRKEKRAAKNNKKGNRGNVSSEDEKPDSIFNMRNDYGSDSEDEAKPAKKLTKKQLKRAKEREDAERRAKEAAFDMDSESENDDVNNDEVSEEEEIAQPVKKLTKKQLKKLKEKEAAAARRKADEEAEAALAAAEAEDEDMEDEVSEEEIAQPVKKLTKKQLKKLKEKEAAAARRKADEEAEAALAAAEAEDEDMEDEVSEEEIAQPVKKLTKKQLKKLKEKEAAAAKRKADEEAEAALAAAEAEDEDMEDEVSEEEQVAQPVKKLTKKQLKKLKEKEAAAAKRKADEEAEAALAAAEAEEENMEDEEELDIADELESKLAIEETTDDKSKKKKKKEKKDKKKSELEKQIEEAMQKKVTEEEENGDDEITDEKKEKALRKAEKEAKKKKKAEKEAKKKAKEEAKLKKAADADNSNDEKKNDDDEEDEVFYGAPDDHAWTDKSSAQIDADKADEQGPDKSLTHDKNGKKLSNKERKRLLKAREAEMRAKEYEITAAKKSAEGAQFACSQTSVNVNDPQWQNSLDINIPSFNISAAGKILFKDSPLVITHGRRYGLVGPNGKGKSTLLKMIASRDLVLPPRVDFLYVEQEVVADNTPAVDAVLKADKARWDLVEEEKKLTELIDAGNEESHVVERLQIVYDELNKMGAASSEAKARRILYGLGFDIEMQTKPTKMFSGGWRMRISLARALFIEPTLLMLDEPTNHLDLNAVIWLDDYLQKWKKTLLVVSHDQDFLNSVCEETLHIESLKVVPYKGGYDSFKKAEKTKRKQQQKNWEKQQKRLRELKRSGKSKAKATEQVKKSSKREPGARSAKKKNDAIASGAATATTTELIERPREYTVKLEFSEVPELSRPVMEVNRVKFRYSPKHPIIFEEVDFGIDMDSRICVVGPNGAGKSTLLKLLTGEITATKGDVRRNPRLRMGIYNQHFVDRLPMSKTPVEHLRDRFQDEDYQSIRNRLGKYGLEGHAHEVRMRDLSGGQKARVVFVELSLQRPHILLLDEPTNNLDIETIDALVDAINNFNGGIVVVTHDQRLIEECDCTLWVVEKQGVTSWEKGFDDYKETLLREMEEAVEKEAEVRRQKLEASAAARAEKLSRLARAKA